MSEEIVYAILFIIWEMKPRNQNYTLDYFLSDYKQFKEMVQRRM